MLFRKNRLMSFGAAALASTAMVQFTTPAALAEVLFEHAEDNDPTTEGWERSASGTVTEGPVVNDTGGFDAWQISDNDSDGFLAYVQELTPEQRNQANTEGWVLRMRVRAVGANSNPDAVTADYFEDGTDRAYQMKIGSAADGDQIVELGGGGGSYISEGEGNVYHLYELEFDPAAGSATLFVDGVSRITGYEGFSFSRIDRVLFGSPALSAQGTGNYNLVQFEIVPEPATLALVGLGGGLMLMMRRPRSQAGPGGSTAG